MFVFSNTSIYVLFKPTHETLCVTDVKTFSDISNNYSHSSKTFCK